MVGDGGGGGGDGGGGGGVVCGVWGLGSGGGSGRMSSPPGWESLKCWVSDVDITWRNLIGE